MYYAPPQPRLLNFISTNGLTMQFSEKVSRIDGHILVDTAASYCYLSSSYVKHSGLHVKELLLKWYWEMNWKLKWRELSMCM